MEVITIEHLTKDYGHQRGVFDVSFTVKRGEVYGFLGPNGAGKTTTIRHIMGFSRPHKGRCLVNGRNSWQHAADIQRSLGYLPGEIALPESLNGRQFIRMMAELRGLQDMSYTDHLIERFELDPSGNLKRMSLGMKRKLAIVTAFMHDPDVLVLDEPTSGLDPIMQSIFIDFIREEKKRGKTILLSSHIFSEVDATCDRISIIKDGLLVSSFEADELRSQAKTYEFEIRTRDEFERFRENIGAYKEFELVAVYPHKLQARVAVQDSDINGFVRFLADYPLKFFSEIRFTLEDYFMKFYDRDLEHEEGADADAVH